MRASGTKCGRVAGLARGATWNGTLVFLARFFACCVGRVRLPAYNQLPFKSLLCGRFGA